ASLNGLYGRPGSVSPSFEHFTMRVIATDSTRFCIERQSPAGRQAIQRNAHQLRAARAGTRGNLRRAFPVTPETRESNPGWRCEAWLTTQRQTVVLSQIKALTHGTVDLANAMGAARRKELRRHGDRPGVLGDRPGGGDRARHCTVAVRDPGAQSR